MYRAPRADRLLVLDGKMQKASQPLTFTLHVSIQQGGVPFSTAPEDIPLTSEPMRGIHGLPDLRRVSEDIHRARCGRAMDIAGCEKSTRCPRAGGTGRLLMLGQMIHDTMQRSVAFGQGIDSGATSRS